MSYIRLTLKCPCGKFMNVSVGSFGGGVPKDCSYCKKEEKFETIADGWYANYEGNWSTDFEDKLNDPRTT